MNSIKELYENPKTGLMGKTAFAKKFGLNIDDVENYLHSTDSYTLNAPAIRNFQRLKTISIGIDYQWQADLVDMKLYEKQNDGFKYLLTCIDITSRFAWVNPLKDKTALTVTKAFDSILKLGRKPKLLQTDNGTEFLSREFQALCKKNQIYHFVPPSNSNASLVERFHKTLKLRMTRYFSLKNTTRYIDVLQDLVDNYNDSYHSSIRYKPNQVNQINEREVINNSNETDYQVKKPKFQVDDIVRLTIDKRTFMREVDDKFNEKLFRIQEVIPTLPITYKLKSITGEEYDGRYYENELIKYTGNINEKEYKIEKIVDVRTKNRRKEILIKWLGYNDSENTWEPLENFQNDDEIMEKVNELLKIKKKK